MNFKKGYFFEKKAKKLYYTGEFVLFLKICLREGWPLYPKWDGCFTNCFNGMEIKQSQGSPWHKSLPQQVHHKAN